MSFAILTTTYKRPEELLRCIESVQMQGEKNIIHYIVNDSPEYSYTETEKTIVTTKNITYIKNERNIGKNASLNKILDILTEKNFTGWVLFLDDDDWLSKTALADFSKNIGRYAYKKWFVSKRVLESGTDLTQNKAWRLSIYYDWDYLLTKQFRGDATHCIEFPKISRVRFPEEFKNGEEWIYFCQVQKRCNSFMFIERTGTYTLGYLADGVTKNYITPPCRTLVRISKKVGILSPVIWLYILLRTVKNLF